MAINLADNNPRVVYSVAEGVTQTVFAVPFEFFEDADVNIYVDGVLKVEGTDYTLTGGDGATGTLTFVTAEPGETQQVTGAVGGSTVVLVRRIAIERTSDFQQGMDISRPALNTQLDVLTALVADMNDRWDRAVHLPDSDTGSINFTLPASSVRAGNYLAFDSNGDPVMTAGTTSTLVVSAFAETFLNDNTGAEVLNTLGVTASPAQLNTLDGILASTSEINLLQNVNGKTGADNRLVTGTAGSSGQYAQWNVDGDIVGATLGAGATAETLLESTWAIGTSTTEAIVSPAKIAASIDAQVDTAKVLSETAGASLGGVGTYAFISTKNTTRAPGDLVAGSDLDWGGVQANGFNNNLSVIVANTSPSLSGTWMCVGWALASAQAATLFLRVS